MSRPVTVRVARVAPAPSRRIMHPVNRFCWFVIVAIASYVIGVSLFYFIDGVTDFATHQAAGGSWHDMMAFMLLALATLTMLVPLLQSSAGRSTRTFGLTTAIMLSTFAVLHDRPGCQFDAPVAFANERVLLPLERTIGR